MSTRALRKLQREQELERQLAAAKAQTEIDTKDEGNAEEEEDEESESVAVVSQPKNAFDMLDAANGDEDENDEEQEQEEESSRPTPPQSSTPKSSSKKKRKKTKKKANTQIDPAAQREDSEDEIDKALKELAIKNQSLSLGEKAENHGRETAGRLLAIDPKNLDPVNEMRGLFGNIALEDDRNARPTPAAGANRRRDQPEGGVDLGTALTGRFNRAARGKSLGALAKRRNCFMQGKEDWPLATSGGLSMELSASEGIEKSYNIMHNQQYKEAQHQFRMMVETMDAMNMIGMLQPYPYHIASLLQVSEIAKHQGDSSVSGDLLERALFTLGRSVQSSFPASTRSGTARVPFDKPANRELYLTIWRYIRNLEQRGTWKTAYEWSKLLLQLNVTSDPYGVTLMIDQLALRGRQHEQFLQLCSDAAYGHAWSHLPNIAVSKCLAYLRAGQPREARKQLAIAMHHYPYLISALASALEVSPIPKNIWGKLPSTDAEKLYTELYVTRAKDLWNTPETIGLISEVANTLSYYKADIDSSPTPDKLEISLEEARHVMLLEIPALIALLPRQFTNMSTSSSDPLPPPNSLEDENFVQRQPGSASRGAQMPAFLQNLLGAGANATAVPGEMVRRILQLMGQQEQPETQEGGNVQPTGAPTISAEDLRDFRDHLGPEAANLSDDALMQMLLAQHIQVDDEELAAAFNAFGPAQALPGGWDYYDEAANASSADDDHGNTLAAHGSDDEYDSMPELEDVSVAQPRPFAPTVEEAEDEEDRPAASGTGRSGPILRHVDDEEQESAHASRTHHASSTQSTPASSTMPSASAPPDDEIELSSQRIQRWLIASGLEDLKENKNTSLYVKRLKMLTKREQDWIINMVRQRGGKDLGDKISALT